jgi:hypothetical protein
MSESADQKAPECLSLGAAVHVFITSRLPAASDEASSVAPEDGQIWGAIGSLMGLSRAERQERQQELLAAFRPAWAAAGGLPRVTSPKKARVEKRKKTVKQIKSRRAEIAKIAAANQRGSGG